MVKNKQGKVIGTKPKLNPAFERVIIVSKNTGKAVSDMLGINDDYLSFCINEAALYVSSKLASPIQSDGKQLLNKLSKRK